MQQLIIFGLSDGAPLQAELLTQADRLTSDDEVVLMGHDTPLHKKGCHSVGVAAQYASALGNTANCQTLVLVTMACSEVPVIVGLPAFLPDSCTDDPDRMVKAGVAPNQQAFCNKPNIAFEEVNRMLAFGVRFSAVPADAGYGLSVIIGKVPSNRNLCWAVAITRQQKVYPPRPALAFPIDSRVRPQRSHIPCSNAVTAETLLGQVSWRSLSWRRSTKGWLRPRLVAIRIRIADGPPQRIRDKGSNDTPGDEICLIGEQRTSGGRNYCPSNLLPERLLKWLAATVKVRCICERTHKQLKEELGVEPFEDWC